MSAIFEDQGESGHCETSKHLLSLKPLNVLCTGHPDLKLFTKI